MITKLRSFLSSAMTVGILVTSALTLLSVEFYKKQHSSAVVGSDTLVGVLDQIYRKTIDFRLVTQGEHKGASQVAILAIDDSSIEREGRWPWSRKKISHLVEKALDGGAKLVTFDIVFSEPDPNSALDALRSIKRHVLNIDTQDRSLKGQITEVIDNKIKTSNSDKVLGDTVDLYSDSLVMGSYFDIESTNVGEKQNPFRSQCIDTHYRRYYEQKYWLPKKDQNFGLLIAEDPFLLPGHSVPPELLSTLSNYMGSLDDDAIKIWLQSNTQVITDIKEALRLNGLDIPEKSIPPIIYGTVLGDPDMIYFVLDQSPELQKFANTLTIQSIHDTVSQTLQPAQLADIKLSISHVIDGYCKRFLTNDDELLDDQKIADLLGKSKDTTAENDPSLKAALDALSFHLAWKRYQASSSNEDAHLSLEEAISRWRLTELPNAIKNYERTWISTGEIARKTRHTGFLNAEIDPDGSIRRTMLIARRGNHYIPSLALESFLIDKSYNARFRFQKDQKMKVIGSFQIEKKSGEKVFEVPVDYYGRMLINYSGPQQMFPHINASSLLQDSDKLEISYRAQDPETGIRGIKKELVDKKAFLKDKLLIVGATAVGVYDLRITPFEENFPGVEAHANILSNLLTENDRATKTGHVSSTQPGFLKIHPDEETYMWLIILIGGIIISAGLTWLGPLSGLVLTLSTLGVIYLIDRYILFANGIVVNISLPIFMVFFNFVSITSYKYFTEEKKKKELKGTFAKYVSPSVVDEILKDPENIELGGKKMELTVLFSDIRGFTTISEKLDPKKLSDLLNSYLTPMTDLVFETKGTLDKYMGDAIMAFWGAPVPLSDSPERAARCALYMLKKLKELQDEYAKQGLPNIDIGIGLNTGDMSVGNMGSNTVRSYTVMGDAVNLGSRLEGINKEYGTRIIISEFTQRKIERNFVTREVDWVRVKGKLQPVRIFELLGERNSNELATPQMMLEILPAFNEGFHLYHSHKFQEALSAFQRANAIKPDDFCTKLYIQRCQDYLEAPPKTDWDGVYTMKTK